MIARIKTYVFCLFFAVISGLMLNSCSKEHLNTLNIPFLGGDSAKGEAQIDKWIYDTLTQPYNVKVIYKFNEFEASSPNVDLVPIKENVVIPSLSDIKKVWIDTYEAEAGTTFIKTYIIKVINMIGSPAYNINGSITLGEAEGGAKINLYDMNNYDINHTNRANIIQKMHTIHHEFGHILQQNKYYSADYQKISVGFYTGNWTLETMDTALSHGFVTPYASSAPDEDFVETIATMLVEGKEYFEGLKTEATQKGYAGAADKLTQKEQIIVAYYKDKWNMDFYDLQKKVKAALDELVPPPPPPPLNTLFGFDNNWQGLIFDDISNQSSVIYKTAYNSASNLMTATGRSISGTKLVMFSTDSAVLSINYMSGTSSFTANYKYKITYNTTQQIVFNAVNVYNDGSGPQANGVSRQAQLQPILDYFSNKIFNIRYYPNDPRTDDSNRAALYLSTDNTSFVSGILEAAINYVK